MTSKSLLRNFIFVHYFLLTPMLGLSIYSTQQEYCLYFCQWHSRKDWQANEWDYLLFWWIWAFSTPP